MPACCIVTTLSRFVALAGGVRPAVAGEAVVSARSAEKGLPQDNRSAVRDHVLHLLRERRSELLPAPHGASFDVLPGE